MQVRDFQSVFKNTMQCGFKKRVALTWKCILKNASLVHQVHYTKSAPGLVEPAHKWGRNSVDSVDCISSHSYSIIVEIQRKKITRYEHPTDNDHPVMTVVRIIHGCN